jgi:hypothetical protein
MCYTGNVAATSMQSWGGPAPLRLGKRPYQKEAIMTVSAMNTITEEMVTAWNERASRYTSLYMGCIVHHDWGGRNG